MEQLVAIVAVCLLAILKRMPAYSSDSVGGTSAAGTSERRIY